jgi:predicted transglutaminase-like cysteine proteinase
VLTDSLQAVLDEAHRGHVYITDIEKHGVPEDWRPELHGDCDSFALWCKEKLKEELIESNLVYCKTELGEYHLVLSVNGYILDNRFRWVLRNDELNYTWISICMPDGKWYKII